MTTLKDRVLGSLLGAAIGDAMGAATEMRTKDQIIEFFGGKVTDFIVPPQDTFARGNKPGQVTDDFSIAHVALETILRNDGVVNEQVAREGLLEWGNIPEFFNRFAGPTTRAAIEAMRSGEEKISKYGFDLVSENDKATNGAAMKASPISTLALGDKETAFNNCMTISMLTHDNNTAFASAAAVVYATSEAISNENAKLEDLISAALEGAQRGDEYGRKHAHTLSNPSIYEKTKLAVSLATNAETVDEATDLMIDIIGTSVYAYESIPAAFGFIVKCTGDPMEPIIEAVNAGNDTDSVATIVGGILGAYYGASAFPASYLELINEANGYNLGKLAEDIIQLKEKN